MGRNPDPLPDECDFCMQEVDEDEELVPVFVGGPPRPEARRATATAEKAGPPRVRGDGPITAGPEPVVLGRTASEWKALSRALEDAGVDFETQGTVVAVEPDAVLATEARPMRAARTTWTNQSGASVTVEPGFEEPEPDMMVCELCVEAFAP